MADLNLTPAKYPTGLDEKVKDLEMFVSSHRQSGKLSIVGISGLGGVGKTTIAKEFFNCEISNYDRSCFLSDVRSRCLLSRSLLSLQSILLKDLSQLDVHINSVDEGIGRLRNRVLIVLDDVDDVDQLDALILPVKDTINPGSLILVTTRDMGVLTSSGISKSSIYLMHGLNPQHSRELFCLHAFGQPHPVVGFEEVVGKFVDASHGLPLSLKVFGELLCGEYDLEYWNLQLDKISITLPNDILGRLKISYDALNKEEQQLFLDIACFFIGEDKDTAIKIWDGSGWAGRPGLRKLEDRCLVEVDSENCLRMHDHLRDLGRYIAENPEHPRRLWRLTDNLLHNVSDQSPVRGISTVHGIGSEQSFVKLAGSCNLSRLQLLRVESYFFESVFSIEQLPQLIYLRWENCPYTSLPSSENLRVLYIKGANLKTFWQHESQAPLRLRELYIGAPISKIPKSIGRLKHLEKFVLCESYIQNLPDEFCNLHSLKHVVLKYCVKMMLLPESVGNLTGLQSLDLSGCSALQTLPDSVGCLRNLQSLDLSGCSALQTLPDSVGCLMNLQSIHLHGCSNLKMLPDSICNLKGLQHIDLSGCSDLPILPNSFSNLNNLRHIDLCKCSNLEMLPYSFGNLRSLQHINLSKCSNLQMLPNSLENLKNLRHIDLSRCSNLQILPNSFGNLRNLQHIDLSWCSNLQMLPNSFGNLTNLQHIDLSWCSNLPILPNSFGNLIQLKHLCLRKCYDLTISNETLGQIRTLEWLEISGCYGIEVLPPQIRHQGFLREMYLFCPFLKELPIAMGGLSNLEILHLASSCLELLEIGTLVSLEELQARECVNLKSIQGLAQLTKLRRLDVVNCSELKELSGVEHLSSLEELSTSGCRNLQLGRLAQLTKLRRLDVVNFSELKELSGVENLSSLEELSTSGCRNLQLGQGVLEQPPQQLKE